MDNRPGVSARGHYLEPVSGRLMTYTVGYITRDHIPYMTLYPDPAATTTGAGEPNEPYTVPIEVLVHAIDIAAAQGIEQASQSPTREAYVCDGCGVSAEGAVGEYDGTEEFYCVECQWDDEHDEDIENCTLSDCLRCEEQGYREGIKMDIEISNAIGVFLHCGMCLGELPEDVSPREWALLEVGWTQRGFQVWCQIHEINVVHMDFEGSKHPARMDCDAPVRELKQDYLDDARTVIEEA